MGPQVSLSTEADTFHSVCYSILWGLRERFGAVQVSTRHPIEQSWFGMSDVTIRCEGITSAAFIDGHPVVQIQLVDHAVTF